MLDLYEKQGTFFSQHLGEMVLLLKKLPLSLLQSGAYLRLSLFVVQFYIKIETV